MSFDIVKGDLEPDMGVHLEVDGVDWPIEVGDVITLKYVDPNGSAWEKTLTVVDMSTGRAKVVWSSGDTDVVGPYRGLVKLTRDGETRSFPNDWSLIIWWVNPDVEDLL